MSDAMSDTLYIEVPGCTTFVAGERGTTAHILYDVGQPVAAFVSLDERQAMFYLQLGARTGERRQHAVVLDATEITRETFDELTGIVALRRELGWTW